MALTTAQRASARLYLGWSERFHQVDSALEQALNAVDGDADVQALVVGLLASISNVDLKLVDAHKRLKVVKVGTIELPRAGEIAALRSEGRRFVGRLASMLGVEVRHDVFSGSGPAHRAGFGGIFRAPGSGGSNLPPMG